MQIKSARLIFLIALLIGTGYLMSAIAGAQSGTNEAVERSGSDTGALEEGSELDKILIDNEGYKKDRKGPVLFSHLKHARDYQISCWECHHDYQGKENVWSPWTMSEICSDCHAPVRQSEDDINLQKAYHLNCRTCHKTMTEQGQKSGPYRKCYDCHQKKNN